MTEPSTNWNAPHRPTVTLGEGAYLLGLLVAVLGGLFLVGNTFGDEGKGLTLALLFIVGLAISLLTSGRRALVSAEARRLKEHELPRIAKLVEGLAKDMLVPVPSLRIVEGRGPNAMVCRSGGPVIAVTDGIASLSLTEIEAVIASCLVRLKTGTKMASLASELLFLAGPLRPMVGFDDDIRAVAVTRYPPAMAAAIEKAEGVAGRHQPLWFVADGKWHRARAERIAAILDL